MRVLVGIRVSARLPSALLGALSSCAVMTVRRGVGILRERRATAASRIRATGKRFDRIQWGTQMSEPRILGGLAVRPPRLFLALLALSIASAMLASSPVRAGSASAERVAGASRYATAAAVSRATYPEPASPTVWIATGEDYADALAAGPASRGDGPVLLVRANSIPSDTDRELKRLKPSRIIIAGGTSVVSSGVQAALAGYGAPVSRQAGANRYATAARISHSVFANPSVPVVYISTGANFADALAAGAATRGQGPVLLVASDRIPPETHTELSRLNPGRIVIAGGTAVVSSKVQTELAKYGAPVSRQAGANRYGTAAQVSKSAFVDPNVSVVFVATGENFADALAGVPAAIRGAGPVVLVRRNEIPSETHAELLRLNPSRIVVVGGTSVVSASVQSKLAMYLATPPSSVNDPFNRSVASGWGSPATGVTWARTIGQAEAFSVGGGYGRTVHHRARTTRQLELRPVIVPLNEEVLLRVQVPNASPGVGNDVHVHAIVRRATGVDFYRLQVAFSGAGSVSLLPQRVVKGVPSGIGPQINGAIPAWSATQTYWIRFQALGANPTTLRARVWRAGTSEPAAWAFSRVDSQASLQQAATSVAFRSFVVAGYSGTLPVEVRIHDFVSKAAN